GETGGSDYIHLTWYATHCNGYKNLGKLTIYNDRIVCQDDASGNYAASSAGTDAYAITLSVAQNGSTVSYPASLTAGDTYTFVADVANTGTASLNVNSIGAKTIKKALNGSLVTLSDNDICVGQIVTVKYDGTQMQMMSPICNAGSIDLSNLG